VARRGGGRSDQRISAGAQRPAPHAALSPGLFAATGATSRAGAAPHPGSGPSVRSPRPAYTVTGASGARLLADWSDARAARVLREGALAHSRSEPAARVPQPASAGLGESRPTGPGMAAGPPGLPLGPSSTLDAEPAEGAARAASRGGSGPVSGPRPHAAPPGSAGSAVAAPAPAGGGGDGRRRSQDHGATLSAVTGAGMLRELQELQARGSPPGGPRREGRSGDAWTVGGGAARGALGRALGVGTLGSASDVLASGRLAGGPLRRGGPRPAPGGPRGGGPGGLGALITGGFARVSGAFAGPAAAGQSHVRGEPGHAPGVQPAGGRAGGRATPSPLRHSSLMDLFPGTSAGPGDGATPPLPPAAALRAQVSRADGPGSHASAPGPQPSGTDAYPGIPRAGGGSGAAAPRPRSVRFAEPDSDAGQTLPRPSAASHDQAPRGAAAASGMAQVASVGADLETGSSAGVSPDPSSHSRPTTGIGSAPPAGGVIGEAQHAGGGQARSAPLAFDIVVDP